jgi:hypothetical protein
VRPHLAAGKPSAARQGFLKPAGPGRGHELAAKNAWRGRDGASKVHPGIGRASSNPYTAWDHGSVQPEAILGAPPRCACTRASPHRRSTHDSFLNINVRGRIARMSESTDRWYRKPFLVGTLSGCVVGILWWAGLVIAFGPSTVVTTGSGGLEEREITVLSRCGMPRSSPSRGPWSRFWPGPSHRPIAARGYP